VQAPNSRGSVELVLFRFVSFRPSTRTKQRDIGSRGVTLVQARKVDCECEYGLEFEGDALGGGRRYGSWGFQVDLRGHKMVRS
jgi:hypothetical protein